MPNDILSPSKVRQLRKKLAPGKGSDTVQIWRRREAMVDEQTTGGAGVDERGYPVLTSGLNDTNPSNNTPGFKLIGAYYCRVESATTGREMDFGGQNTEVEPWDIVMSPIDPDTGEEIEIQAGDEMRVLQDDGKSWRTYQAISADDGETLGVLLTVHCQRI